jgi:hypothetical protein
MRRRLIRVGLFHSVLALGHRNPVVLGVLAVVIVVAVVMAFRNRGR